MTFKKTLTGFTLSILLIISSAITVFAIPNRTETATGSYGSITWTASNKVSDNAFSAKFSVDTYFRNNVEVIATAVCITSSGRELTSQQSSGICYQSASTDSASKRIYLADMTTKKLYSSNYIDGSLCKTLYLYP